MSIDTRATSYGKIFGDWTINEMIGKGSNGKTAVFKVTRNNRTYEDVGAMKVVTILEQKGRKKELSDIFLENYEKYCEEFCDKAENELNLMNLLGISGNVVNYHDHRFEEWEDDYSFGIDLLIRMDLLNSLDGLRKKKVLEEQEIIKIGIDISNALICCHDNGILHRDIKPDNIFFNDYVYLLGDFGISKMLENSNSAETRTGTEAYAAPEQFVGHYDHRVDIYSLGLTLYELANGNRLPFAKTTFARSEEVWMRLNGKPLPKPEYASNELSEVILCACDYDPNKRFQTAKQFNTALQRLMPKKNKLMEMEKSGEDMYTTMPVMEKSGEDMYTTMLTMKKPEEDIYTTMPTMKKLEEDMYTTMPTMKKTEEDIYTTMPTMEKPREDMYTTMPTMEKPREDMYTTMPTMKKPGEDIYTTMPTMKKLAGDLYTTMPVMQVEENEDFGTKIAEVEEVIPMFNIEECPIDYLSVGRAYFENGDYKKAVDWFQKAKSNNSIEALYELSVCFMNGMGVEKDIPEAMQMLIKCAQQCDNQQIRGLAKFKVGQIYETEFGTESEIKIAEEWYKESAKEGNLSAQKKITIQE